MTYGSRARDKKKSSRIGSWADFVSPFPGETIDDIPEAVIQDCCQLVKANSIQGNKMNNIDIVYTRWANLKKTADMAVGQIGFHKQREVKKIRIEKRINEIVNR